MPPISSICGIYQGIPIATSHFLRGDTATPASDELDRSSPKGGAQRTQAFCRGKPRPSFDFAKGTVRLGRIPRGGTTLTEALVRERLRDPGDQSPDNGITGEAQKSEIAKVKTLLSPASKNAKGTVRAIRLFPRTRRSRRKDVPALCAVMPVLP